jgi:hypothetical protein
VPSRPSIGAILTKEAMALHDLMFATD